MMSLRRRGLLGGKALPDYMPIVSATMSRGDYRSSYPEREIAQPVDLCDEWGALNPEAIGWSRRPLHVANMRGM